MERESQQQGKRAARGNRSSSSPEGSTDSQSSNNKGPSEFLFVNRTQETIGQGTRSRKVSTHVQHTYRSNASRVQTGESGDSSPMSPSGPSTTPTPRRGGEVQPWRIERPPRHRKRMETATSESSGEDFLQGPSTLSIVAGNSDPFAALPVSIDPVTNRILSWYRDDGLPGLFPLEKAVFGKSMPAAKRDWNTVISSLQSPSLGPPLLASISGFMARITQSDVIRGYGLQLKGKSYSILRTHLEQAGNAHGRETWRMILYMFWAELHTGGIDAAETHLASLAGCLQPVQASELDSDFRTEILTADVVLAVTQTSVPLFQAGRWAAENFHDNWKGEMEGQTLFLEPGKISDSVTDADTRSVLIRLRELINVAELLIRRRIRNYSAFQWAGLRLLSCESELLALSHGHNQSALGELTQSTPSDPGNSLKYCVCIAALAWICSAFASTNRNTQDILVVRLREAQQQCVFDASESPEAVELSIWSSHVRGVLERKAGEANMTASSGGFVAPSNPFSGSAEPVTAEVTEILRSFLHSDFLGR